MKKLKIKGITGMPLFLTRFHGYLDGKRGAVAFMEDEWHGHYLENKKAVYSAFVHSLYTGLENNTAPLHKESAELVVEHEEVQEKLQQPEETASGITASIQARNAGRISGERQRLQFRKQEIELRLTVIDEDLIYATNDVASKQREATALTNRRLQAYLHGASLAARKSQAQTKVDIHHDFEEEDDFRSRHKLNDAIRRAVIESSLKGVALQ